MHAAKRKNSAVQFTIKSIAALDAAEPGKEVWIYDATVPSLCVRVTDKGSRSWYLRKDISGTSRKIKIGDALEMPPESARRKAIAMLADIANGIDPTAIKQIGKITLRESLAEYIQAHDLSERTIEDYRSSFNETWATIQDNPMSTVTRSQVRDLYLERAELSKARANNAARVLRAVWNYARASYRLPNGDPALPENPIAVLSDANLWRKTGRKQTYIPRQHFKSFWLACEQLRKDPVETIATAGALFQFLVLTGLRLGEAQMITDEMYDRKARAVTLPSGTTKNRRQHEIPLSKQAHAVIEGQIKRWNKPQPFAHAGTVNEWSKAASVIAGIKFTPHDLRRTFLTYGEACDLSSLTCKRLANHVSGDSDVTAGYIIRDAERLRDAAQQIADYMEKLIKSA